MANKRNYGIDLLRIILMYMVCMLHTLGQGGVLDACQIGTIEYKTYWFLEIFSYCAVDGFGIISGYMATDKPRRYEKLADMWFQAFFYSFVVTAVFVVAGLYPVWSGADMIKSALPVTNENFWYFTAFFVLYLATPLLNKFLFTIDESTAKKIFVIIFFMFSYVEFTTGAFKTQGGYSPLWLIILYCMGVLAKKGKIFGQKKTISLILIWGICIILTWYDRVFTGSEHLTSYVSPTILTSALIMVILFSRLRLKGTVISKVSPYVFGIYLFQFNQVIWNDYLNDVCSFVAEFNIVSGVVYAFAFAAFIFISGYIVELVRSTISKAIKISLLSKEVVNVLNKIIKKTFIILK